MFLLFCLNAFNIVVSPGQESIRSTQQLLNLLLVIRLPQVVQVTLLLIHIALLVLFSKLIESWVPIIQIFDHRNLFLREIYLIIYKLDLLKRWQKRKQEIGKRLQGRIIEVIGEVAVRINEGKISLFLGE